MGNRGADMANEYRRHKEAEEKMQTEFKDEYVYVRQILFEKHKTYDMEKVARIIADYLMKEIELKLGIKP